MGDTPLEDLQMREKFPTRIIDNVKGPQKGEALLNPLSVVAH